MMTKLHAIDGGPQVAADEAEAEAWRIVAGAFDRAAAVPGLTAEVQGEFAKRRRLCREIVGRPLLDPEAVAR